MTFGRWVVRAHLSQSGQALAAVCRGAVAALPGYVWRLAVAGRGCRHHRVRGRCGFRVAVLDVLRFWPRPHACAGRLPRLAPVRVLPWMRSPPPKPRARPSCPGPGVARTCPLSRGCARVPRTSPAPPRRAGLSCRMAPGGRARACWPRPWPGWGSRCTPSRLRLWCRRRRCRGRGPRGLSSGCRAGGCRHRGRLRLRSQLSLSASASTSTKPPFRAVFFARNFRDLGFGN